MALQLTREMPQGFSYNYHRIRKIELHLDGSCSVHVQSFKDAAARQAIKSDCGESYCYIPAGQVDQAQPLLPQIYNILKSQLFVGAIDC